MAIVKNVQRGCLTLIKSFQPLLAIQCEKLHTSPLLNAWTNEKDGKKTNKWLKYNDVVFPPQKPNEPPRPAVSND